MTLQYKFNVFTGNFDLVNAPSTPTSSVASVDISDQFDGSTSTFTIPSYSSILSFTLTGWSPNGNLRPTVDFTTPTDTTVSLVTSSVSAPQLGTTGIILYIPS